MLLAGLFRTINKTLEVAWFMQLIFRRHRFDG